MRALFSVLSIVFISVFALPAYSAINPDPSPAPTPDAAHPTNKYLNIARILPSLTGEPALDRLKRRVEVHGFLTVATAELGMKSDMFEPRLSRLEYAESQIKAVNPAAATTLLIFASGCLMWLGLYEKRPY